MTDKYIPGPAQFGIGDFTISHLTNGKLWINYKTGEGGEFSAAELEAVIYIFFWENF